MTRVIPLEFLQRPTLEVAPELLGLWLVHQQGQQLEARRITEVEAYLGPEDLASHARFGSSRRNAVMFGPGGHWYVYLIYGIHNMLNIVTGPAGEGGACLLRGAIGLPGPGRLAKGFGITPEYNALAATRARGLWLERREPALAADEIATSPRIGIDYAGSHWGALHYRFYWKAHVKK